MLVDTGDINNALKYHFSSIGQDRVDTENNIFQCEVEDFVSKIDHNLITSDNPISLNIHRENIKSVLESLRSGKACGIDEIPNEFLKYGGSTLLNSLLDLFTKITDLEKIPEDWHKGIIKPIHKRGSIYDLDNYRGITLTSNVYKVYAKIIEQSVMSYMEDNGILGEAQGAFRRDRRTEDNIFTLQGICALRKSKKGKTFLAFLDLSKAFDRVWREGLFDLLWKNGIQGKCWKLLRSLYSNVSNKVLFGDFESDRFDQEFGLIQGCVLSPTLFSVLMNDLVSMLSEHNLGVNLASDIINYLLFADDIVLIGKSEQELETLLNITGRFASKWNLKFNSKKSKVMVIGKKIDKLKRWDIENDQIEEANVYKYLGVYFSRSLKFTYHIETKMITFSVDIK